MMRQAGGGYHVCLSAGQNHSALERSEQCAHHKKKKKTSVCGHAVSLSWQQPLHKAYVFQNSTLKPGVVAHAHNPNTPEVEAEGK